MIEKIIIALSGNPNSGKTTVFNAITGARQHIANYPGVTVEKKYGSIVHNGVKIDVVDLPGTYSLTAYSLEEIVARDFLINERPDVVVDIVDASNLDRNLYLAVQFKELGTPLIVALNMIDMASSRGIIVDADTLSNMLDSPVVPMVARSKKGIKELLDKIIDIARTRQGWDPAVFSYGRDVDQSIRDIQGVIESSIVYEKKYPSRWLALKCIEGDEQILELLKQDKKTIKEIEAISSKTTKHIEDTLEDEPEGIIADYRYGYIRGITKKAVKRKIESRLNFSDKIDKVLTNRILGPVIMMLILYGIYVFTFWGSEAPVAWFEGFFGWLKKFFSLVLPEGILQSLIVSGIIDGVGGVLGFAPLIMFIFFALAFMEDSGYLARVAYMLDRVLRWFGLHGNSVMALLISGGISGGCAVPGVMATRTLRDPKERIATLLVVPFMNCGAKLPLFGLLIAAFFQKNKAQMLFIFTLIAWAFALLAAKIIRATLLRGPKTPFVMELPPYRIPTIKGLAIHTWERTWQYVKKAGTMILGISILLWFVMTFPGLPGGRMQYYENQRIHARNDFFSRPGVKQFIKDERTLGMIHAHVQGDRRFTRTYQTPGHAEEEQWLPLLDKISDLKQKREPTGMGDDILTKVASAYLDLMEKQAAIDGREQEEMLRHTIAGRIGQTLARITGSIGFDYKINVALLGGFAAKEVIVSTLGTAYSLGDVDPESGGSLSEMLAKDPDWNPLVAFTLIIFTMLYVPCFPTLVIIKKESNWRWACFSIVFNLCVAYLISLFVYQTGLALNIGTR